MVPVEALKIRAEIAKRARPRSVPLSKRLQDAISGYKNDKRSLFANPANFAFPSSASNSLPISERSVQRLIDTVTLRVVGRSLSPHNLRHTFATNLLQVTNIRVVQELLGHAHVSSTQIYTHTTPADLQKAIDSASIPRVQS
jgi:integrase/recombinase XerC